MKVQLTIEWDITEKEWITELQHLKEMKSAESVIVEDDVIHTIFVLNDVAYPKVLKANIL